MSATAADPRAVPVPTPEVQAMAMRISILVLEKEGGAEAPVVAEAMMRACAIVCVGKAKPGKIPEMLLLASDMFRRWALTGHKGAPK